VISKQYAAKNSYSIPSNKELVALGLANIVSGLFFSMPACGSFPRSKINDMAGAKTQLSGFLSGVCVILACAYLLPMLGK